MVLSPFLFQKHRAHIPFVNTIFINFIKEITMNNQPSKIKATISAIIIPLVLSVSFAAEAAKTASVITGKNITANNKDSSADKTKINMRKEIVKEANEAAKATQTALKALENNQSKQAIAALQVASGNLHLLLARDPSLGLLPIDYQIQVIEGITDLKTIKRLEDELEDLIDDKHYLTARPIIDSLVDEIRVTTVYLPLATYPAVIDEVAPLIDAGKIEEAKQKLYDVLSTFVSTEEITPLSIIRAEEKITEAFQIEHKGDLTKQDTKDKIAKLVNDANQDVKVAQVLGYGTKDDYEILYDSMDALKKAIGTAGFKGEWSKVKKSISAFKNRIVHPRG
jgi:hypothetical protein